MKHLAVAIGIMGASFFAEQASPADLAVHILTAPANPRERVVPFVSVLAGLIALTHVRVIDGTGAAPQDDRTLIIESGKISAVQPGDGGAKAGACDRPIGQQRAARPCRHA